MARPYRILIAVDEPFLRDFLGHLIGQCYPAAAVCMVVDGLVALGEYGQDGADLLIVSHGLRGMDGATLIRAVRARQALVPILAMSGDPTNEAESRRAGANVFLSGPFTIAAFRQTVYRLLPC